jgi:hypothetical protein
MVPCFVNKYVASPYAGDGSWAGAASYFFPGVPAIAAMM